MVKDWNKLEQGDTVSAEIDYISNSGNGMVLFGDHEVNIGQVTKEAVGKVTELQKLSSQYAICLIPEFRNEFYFDSHPASRGDFYYNTNTKENPKYRIMVSGTGHPQNGERFVAKIDRIGHSGKGIIDTSSGHDVIVNGVKKDDAGGLIEAEMTETRKAKKISDNVNIHQKWSSEKDRDDLLIYTRDMMEKFEFEIGDQEQVFKSTIDRVSGGGNNRIVYINDKQVNIGPVPADPGQQVNIIQIDDDHPSDNAQFGCALFPIQDSEESDQLLPDNYLEEVAELARLPTAELRSQVRNKVSHAVAGFSSPEGYNTSESVSQIDTSVTEAGLSDSSTKSEHSKGSEKPESVEQSGESEVAKESGETEESATYGSTSFTSEDLSSLRNQAEQEAETSINSEQTHTRTTETSEYTRSEAVRNYVKARADGVCEHCGEPAPFRNPDGDPYLHAHHVHELSDGGTDTPDTVIAVCPNCHYHAHHGNDKEEFNEQLIEDLADIEDIPVEVVKNPDS